MNDILGRAIGARTRAQLGVAPITPHRKNLSGGNLNKLRLRAVFRARILDIFIIHSI